MISLNREVYVGQRDVLSMQNPPEERAEDELEPQAVPDVQQLALVRALVQFVHMKPWAESALSCSPYTI